MFGCRLEQIRLVILNIQCVLYTDGLMMHILDYFINVFYFKWKIKEKYKFCSIYMYMFISLKFCGKKKQNMTQHIINKYVIFVVCSERINLNENIKPS